MKRSLEPSILTGTALLLTTLLLLPALAYAERFEDSESANERRSQWMFVSPVGALFKLLPTLDPDEPTLRFASLGGRKEATAGGQFIVAGRRSSALDVSINLSGFIALINFDDQQAMPWQSFRGYMGINTIWRSRWLDERLLPRGGELFLELGFYHESDHAVSLDSFSYHYLRNPMAPFDNGNFSSFEFFKLRLRHQHRFLSGRIVWTNALGVRAFTPSINPWAHRDLRYAVSAETRCSVGLVRRLHAFFGLFYESLANDFVSRDHNFQYDLDGTSLRYLLMEWGFALRSRGGQSLLLSLTFSRSNGRGLDFAEMRTEWGWSLRGHL